MAAKDWEAIESPVELADRLWTFEALHLRPARFRKLANRVWNETRNARAMWRLGGAIHDYLRHRPHAMPVPVELPAILLASKRVDARVIGLKLSKHCDISDDLMLREVLRALNQRRNYERCGGIHELDRHLERLGKRRLTALPTTVSKIKRRLQALCLKLPDRFQRAFATAVLVRLELATAEQTKR